MTTRGKILTNIQITMDILFMTAWNNLPTTQKCNPQVTWNSLGQMEVECV
jgi:hypothetical protein